jgi:hypothetical protein
MLGPILTGMGYIERQLDTMGRPWSRSWAIANIAIFSFLFFSSVFLVAGELRSGDASKHYFDFFMCPFSALYTLISIGMLRAINRRQAAERSIAP